MTIGGRYVVEEVLARGGMGLLLRGRHLELGQSVAIKLLQPELAESNPILAERFLREARLAAKVDSPHLVRVSDVSRLEDGTPFLVMELLKGRDLADELRARGPLPVHVAVDYILQTLAGVAAAHASGIVHRDLKPANIFLSEGLGGLTVKVLDFGISRDLEPTSANPKALTATEHVLGTPQYMSPEQIKDSRTVDERADLWSIGVILYELLTGLLPFEPEGEGLGAYLGCVLYTDAIRPRARGVALPDELEAVIMRCLAKDREARFGDAGELALALAPFAPTVSQHRVALVRSISTPHEIATSEVPERAGPSRAPTMMARLEKAAPPTTPSATPEVKSGDARLSVGEPLVTPELAPREPDHPALTPYAAPTPTQPSVGGAPIIKVALGAFGAIALIGAVLAALSLTRSASQPAPQVSRELPTAITPDVTPTATAAAKEPEPATAPNTSAAPSEVTTAEATASVTTHTKPVSSHREKTATPSARPATSAPPTSTKPYVDRGI